MPNDCFMKNSCYICSAMDAKQLSILFNRAKEFAKSEGFNYIKFDCIVNNSVIYYVQEIAGDMGCTGSPFHVIITEELAPRILPWDEYCQIRKEDK